MTIEITGRHFTVSPSLREHANDKIRKLGRLVEQLEIHVTLEPEKQGRCKCHIVANGNGETHTADVVAEEFQPAINEAVDILSRQLRKAKTSKLSDRREGAATIRHPDSLPAPDGA